jgi:hypothetical protein
MRKLGVHHFIFKSRRQHAGRCRIRTVFEAHQHVNLRAERGAIEFKRLFAAAAEH